MFVLEFMGTVFLALTMVVVGINVLDDCDTYLINKHPPDGNKDNGGDAF